ncbi:hypothetical protein D2Q93_06490 [Alicyclobacillaceae bacterium I2511]|nr:hypothetical protein D2Q93_06490 [Alicyclobacillaceae bacterium I2511]
MSKQTDRVFNITVSVFALTLTGVIGTTMWTGHIGAPVDHWLATIRQWMGVTPTQVVPSGTGGSPAVHPQGPGLPRGQGTVQPLANATPGLTGTKRPAQSAVAGDLRSKPVFHAMNNTPFVHVDAAGTDVSAADLQRVQGLLNTFQIVNRLSTWLQMNLNENVQIEVARSPADYAQALDNLGVSAGDAKRYSLDTGGFTQGTTVVIPLYQNQTQADLANTLGHEMTHVYFNANVGTFPSWMNEGTAVTDGMQFQSMTENPVEYAGYAQQMAESVIQSAANGTLIPLAGSESVVLAGQAPYDLELQDWLAMKDLILRKGYGSLTNYFYRLSLGESQTVAFANTFGVTETAFNTQLTQLLKQSAMAQDRGVLLTVSFPASYQGSVQLLQHGQQIWYGFRVHPGTLRWTVLPTGKLQGVVGSVDTLVDANAPDPDTLYIDLDPTHALTYQGQLVANSGFAIDYHNGMYSFINGWVTGANGKSAYLDTPQLFGIQIAGLTHVGQATPLQSLLTPLFL